MFTPVSIVSPRKGGVNVERLVTRIRSEPSVPTEFDIDFAFDLDKRTFDELQRIFNQLCDLTDILGDDYDLDRLKELLEKDRNGAFDPYSKFPEKGQEVWYWDSENGISRGIVDFVNIDFCAPVSGLPADMSIGGEPFGENGAVYIPVNVTTGDYPAFYKVDVKTGQATKGLSVKADQITTAGVLNKQE